MESGTQKKVLLSKSKDIAVSIKRSDHYFSGKSDMEIWSMFKSGHEGAFRYIYETNTTLLFRFGYKFTSDRELIKDCVQDLFIELRMSAGLSDTDSIKFYLLKAFKWKLIRMLGKKKDPKEITAHEDFRFAETEQSAETRMIHQEADREAKVKLKKVINNLSRQERAAIYYFYTQGLDYEQMRAIMGLQSVKSARNLLYKSLAALRALYKV